MPVLAWRFALEFLKTYRIPLLVFTFGLLLSGLAYGALRTVEAERLQAEFETVAENRRHLVRHEMIRQGELLHSIERFYRSSDRVTEREFEQFLAGTPSMMPALMSLAWVPRVSRADRARHEATLSLRGLVPGRLAERDSGGQWRVAGDRPDYFPATFTVVAPGEIDPLGFDYGSVPDRRAVIERALRSNEIVVSTHDVLIFDTELQGYIVLEPIRLAGAADADTAMGVVAAVFRMETVLRSTFTRPDPSLAEVAIRDISNEDGVGARIVVAPNGLPSGRDRAAGVEDLRGPRSTSSFAWGGRIWEVTCTASAAFRSSNIRHDAVYVFLLASLANIFFSLYLGRRAGKRAAVSQADRERMRRIEQRQERLLALNKTAGASDIAESLGDLCSAVAECLAADRASAWLVSGPGRQLVRRAVADRDVTQATVGATWDLDAAPAYSSALTAGTHVAIRDVSRDALGRALNLAGGGDERVVARLDVAVRRAGALAGVLSVGVRQARDWSPDDIALASSLADLFASRLEEYERRQAEEALRESRRMLQRGEARLRLMLDQAPIGIASLTRDGRFVRTNRALGMAMGRAPEGMVGQSLLESVIEEDRLAVGSVIARLAAGEGAARDLDFRVHRHGGVAVIAGRFAVVREQDGQAGEIVAQFEDVTERIRAEKAIKESEARYRGIFECGADALLLIGTDGVIRGSNPRTSELYAWSREELRGMPFERLMAPGHQGILAEAVAAVRDGRSFSAESEDVRQNGAIFPVEVKVSPFLYEGETVMLWSSRDISERRAAEEERRRLLAQEHEARAAAEQAVRARDTFLSVASHELRTPLTVLQLNLQGLARMVEKEAEGLPGFERLQEFTRTALRQGDRLNQFVDVLLDTTRIASGHFKLKTERVDLAQVAREMVERLGEALKRARVEARVMTPVEAWGAWDRFRIEQVVTNLVTNAMRYGFGKPVTIAVRVEEAHAILEVRDEGVGIDPADHERIFQKFERVSSGPHRGGLGLGLYIVREIAEAHHGRVEVESAIGSGSLFRVVLPREPERSVLRVPDEDEVPAGEPLAESSVAAAAGPAWPITPAPAVDRGVVMVVEDDVDIRQLMAELLEDAGFVVLRAGDGREALAALEAGARPRLILLDLMMPVMDGIAFRTAQLQRPDLARIPVILLSADQRARERCRDLAIGAFLAKPVPGDELLETVTRMLVLN